MANTTRRIGLTGGIGSGKSTVARMLTTLGAVPIDTDAISRQLTAAGGAAIEPLRAAFGDRMIDHDGALHRERMRALAFGDPSQRRRLEAILHPLIADETARQATAAGDSVLVFDVPLLVESGRWRQQVERVLVVDCPREVQVRRVVSRSGLDAATVERIMAQQESRERRRACADAVLFNGHDDLTALERAVAALWSIWVHP